MNIILAVTNWNDVWAMTGIGIGVVFLVLVLLVFVLMLLGKVVPLMNKKTASPAASATSTGSANDETSVSGAEEVAIATAVYLYLQDMHDEESGVLTICHTPGTLWHHELNKHLN